MKNYYIVYASGNMTGSCRIRCKKIKTMRDVKAIADFISKEWCKEKMVILLNWKVIKGE